MTLFFERLWCIVLNLTAIFVLDFVIKTACIKGMAIAAQVSYIVPDSFVKKKKKVNIEGIRMFFQRNKF